MLEAEHRLHGVQDEVRASQGVPVPGPCRSGLRDGYVSVVAILVTRSFTLVKEKCPVEFSAFTKCLDVHNTRLEDCRKTQKKFMACWNKKPEAEEKKE